MTESEKKIEGDGAIWAEGFTRVLANGSVETYYGEQHGWCATSNPDAQATAIRGLTTLLDERRAEMEELKVLVAGKAAGALEVYAAGEVDAKVTSAHDAALEAAETACDALCRRLQRPGPAAACADAIRALKSQPARQYVDKEKVREVLRALWQQATQEKGYRCRAAQLLKQAAERLGVDLDARSAIAETDVYERGGFIPPEGKR